MNLEIIVGYFIVGTIWGATNALMEVGSKEGETKAKPSTSDTSDEKTANEQKPSQNAVIEGLKMFANLRFLLPFLGN